jgi:hypothetical protein
MSAIDDITIASPFVTYSLQSTAILQLGPQMWVFPLTPWCPMLRRCRHNLVDVL